MRKFLLLLSLCFLLAAPAHAVDALTEEANILGTDTLYDGLSEDVQQSLQEVSPTQTVDFGKQLLRVVSDALSSAGGDLKSAAKTACLLIILCVLLAAVTSLETQFSKQAVLLAGALGILSVCTVNLHAMLGLASETLDGISNFSALLLPVMSSAAVASGQLTGGTALYIGSGLFSNILTTAIRSLLIPMVYAYVVMAAAECVDSQGRLTRFRELTGWAISSLLKGVMYLFTAYLALTGVLTGSADAATVKAAKAALSGAVPVVGGIISDASETVLASAALLKSTVGVFGMLAAIAIGITPFLRIGTHYLVLKLTAAVCGTVGSAEHTKLLGNLSTAMGYMLAMTGSCTLMTLICCCCFMKVVGG